MAHRANSGHEWTWLRRPTHSVISLALVCSLLLSSVRAQYFIINQPSASTSLANGSPYPFSWTKGLLDGIATFDIELTRLRSDGLYLVVQNVPGTYKTLNILLQDVPPGDDYFFLCLNSTHSIVYAISPRFTVTNASTSLTNPSPDPSVPTVTISGTPNPLQRFAYTLGPALSAGGSLVLGTWSPNSRALWFGGVVALFAAFLGGAMTLW